MAEVKVKRPRNFDRVYSDAKGELSVTHTDDTVAEVALSSVHPDVIQRAALRYIADIIVGVGNAALKAEGGTPESAEVKMAETLKALQDGTFRFRNASGTGGLSDEDANVVIAEALVTLEKAATVEAAAAIVATLYGQTSKNKKGYIVRKDYNALKNVPEIRAALAKASKGDSGLDSILAKASA